MELNKAFPEEGFTWMKFLRSNGIALGINIVVGLIFILSKEETSVLYPMGKFMAAVLGFTGQTIFLNAVDSVTKDKKTVVGINK